MKLPDALIIVPGSVIDRPLQIEDAEIIEAVVRDCAKTACTFDWNYHANPRASVFKAILARYGLEPK